MAEPEREESLCARCAASGKTCCQGTQVFLTSGDVERIARVAEKGDGEFWEYALPDENQFADGVALDPAWGGVLRADGTRRVIRHDTDGNCRFLGRGGCVLPLDKRPLVCRLYPFDYNGDTIKGVYGHLCPSPEAMNGPLLLALLGMGREEAEQWRRMLYAEIAAEFSNE